MKRQTKENIHCAGIILGGATLIVLLAPVIMVFFGRYSDWVTSILGGN